MIFNSVKETQQFASDYAKEISKGKVIALIGDLGTGMTTIRAYHASSRFEYENTKNILKG